MKLDKCPQCGCRNIVVPKLRIGFKFSFQYGENFVLPERFQTLCYNYNSIIDSCDQKLWYYPVTGEVTER